MDTPSPMISGVYNGEKFRCKLKPDWDMSQFHTDLRRRLGIAEGAKIRVVYHGGDYDGCKVTDVGDLSTADVLRVEEVESTSTPPLPKTPSLPASPSGKGPGLAIIPYAKLSSMEKLGEGAFGDVFRAMYSRAPVAVKRSKVFHGDSALVEKEIKLLGAVPPHPNVVRVMGVCTDAKDGNLLIVMELCEGGNVQEYIAAHQPLSMDVALSLMIQAGTGVSHLHSCGIIHRDIRSVNLLVSPPQRVLVTDFGISHLMSDEAAKTGVSQTVTKIGPIAWRAPETLQGSEMQIASTKTDVYMFGCFMLEVLSGREPWWWCRPMDALLFHRAKDIHLNPLDDAIVTGQMTYAVVPSDSCVAGIEDVVATIRWTLAADPASRPEMNDVLAHLDQLSRPPASPVASAASHYDEFVDVAPRAGVAAAAVEEKEEEEEEEVGAGLTLGEALVSPPSEAPPNAYGTMESPLGEEEEGFAARGALVATIPLKHPSKNCGIAVTHDGEWLLVSHWESCEVSVYALPHGGLSSTFGGRGSDKGQFDRPFGVCTLENNNVLVAEQGNCRVQVVTLTGRHVRFIGVGVLEEAVGAVSCNETLVAVGHCGAGRGFRVCLFELASGALLSKLGPLGVDDGCLGKFCSAVRFSPNGAHLLVAEADNNRLSLWTLEGEYVFTFGEGEVAAPRDVAFSASWDIVVADSRNHRLCVFSGENGLLLRSWGSEGTGPGQFKTPYAVASFDRHLYVLDYDSARVQVFV